MIRLLLADDHRMFREGLRRLLTDQPDMQVAAEAATAVEVLEALRLHQIDVAVLDLSMPGRAGPELIAHAKSTRPSVRILVLTMHDLEPHVTQSLRAGADGYATKDIPTADLEGAIRRIHAGNRYLSPAVAERLALGVAMNPGGNPQHARLSDREYRIFEMLVAGKRGWEIASELSLSEKTVSTHKINLLRKMNLANRTELIRYAIRERLVAV
ncbi:MAG: response regulator [Burkholderiaceae bacterium]